MILREAVPHRMSRLAITGAALAALLMLPGWASPTASPPPQRPEEPQIVTASTRPLDQAEEPRQAIAKESPNLPAPAVPAVSPAPSAQNAKAVGKPPAATPDRPGKPKQESAMKNPVFPLPGTPTASTPSPRQLAELQNVTVGSGLQIRSNYTDPSKTIDLEKECSIHFENQHLSSIVDYLSEFYGYNFVMDPRVIAPKPATPVPGFATPPNVAKPSDAAKPAVPAFHEYATDGMVSFIKLEKVPLRKALEALLRPVNLGFRTVGSVIFISTPENLAKANPKAPVLSSEREALAKWLNDEVALEFEDQALARIFDYMRKYFSVSCEIDPEAKLPGTDRAAKEAFVSHIKLEKVPLWEALYWMTLTSDLTYTVKGETVWITTPDRIAAVGE